jgi:hypothetical protein
VSNFLAKKACQQKLWSKGNKTSSVSCPGQAKYTLKISGCCPKKWQASFYFFLQKACQKGFCSEVYANWRTSTKASHTHHSKNF